MLSMQFIRFKDQNTGIKRAGVLLTIDQEIMELKQLDVAHSDWESNMPN